MFLDANVFIYAFDTRKGKMTRQSARFLERVMAGEQHATTSPLVINEVLFYFHTNVGLEAAEDIYHNILSMQGIYILPVDIRVLRGVMDFVKQGLLVTDAFHAATMAANGISTLCSFDRDFDKIKGISRQEPK
jgi:predicted nucleic acid-binding protein